MSEKIAYLVSALAYFREPLSQAAVPRADLDQLANALRDPKIGNFDRVELFEDPSVQSLQELIRDLFFYRRRYDSLFLYLNGVCLLPAAGEIFLACYETEIFRIEETAVSSTVLSNWMDKSFSRRQIVVLDCLFIHWQPADTAAVQKALAGAGKWRKIISSGRHLTLQEFESRDPEKRQRSDLGDLILEGLQTGDADLDRDGLVTVHELHKYVRNRGKWRLPDDGPQLWQYGESESFVLARIPSKSRKTPRMKWDVLAGTIMVPLLTVLIGWQSDPVFAAEMALLFFIFFLVLLLGVD